MTRLAATAAESAVPMAKPLQHGAAVRRARWGADGSAALDALRAERIGAVKRSCRGRPWPAAVPIAAQFGARNAAGRHMRLDLACMAGIELAVEQRMDQNFGFGADHVVDPSSSQSTPRAAWQRARASRDITVPTGDADDIGDLAIGQIVDLAQHDRLAERLRQRRDEPADRCRRRADAAICASGDALRLLPER